MEAKIMDLMRKYILTIRKLIKLYKIRFPEMFKNFKLSHKKLEKLVGYRRHLRDSINIVKLIFIMTIKILDNRKIFSSLN